MCGDCRRHGYGSSSYCTRQETSYYCGHPRSIAGSSRKHKGLFFTIVEVLGYGRSRQTSRSRFRTHSRQNTESPSPRTTNIPLLGDDELESRESSKSKFEGPSSSEHQQQQIPNRLHITPKLHFHPTPAQRHLPCLPHQRICRPVRDSLYEDSERNTTDSYLA